MTYFGRSRQKSRCYLGATSSDNWSCFVWCGRSSRFVPTDWRGIIWINWTGDKNETFCSERDRPDRQYSVLERDHRRLSPARDRQPLREALCCVALPVDRIQRQSCTSVSVLWMSCTQIHREDWRCTLRVVLEMRERYGVADDWRRQLWRRLLLL